MIIAHRSCEALHRDLTVLTTPTLSPPMLGVTANGRHRPGPTILSRSGHRRLAGAGQRERHESCGQSKEQVEELQGKSKEATGPTGDNELKAEDKKDQAKTKLKKTGETIKDAFK
jgi:uncharacterized protein YjbJ (UPF0337 family)